MSNGAEESKSPTIKKRCNRITKQIRLVWAFRKVETVTRCNQRLGIKGWSRVNMWMINQMGQRLNIGFSLNSRVHILSVFHQSLTLCCAQTLIWFVENDETHCVQCAHTVSLSTIVDTVVCCARTWVQDLCSLMKHTLSNVDVYHPWWRLCFAVLEL